MVAKQTPTTSLAARLAIPYSPLMGNAAAVPAQSARVRASQARKGAVVESVSGIVCGAAKAYDLPRHLLST